MGSAVVALALVACGSDDDDDGVEAGSGGSAANEAGSGGSAGGSAGGGAGSNEPDAAAPKDRKPNASLFGDFELEMEPEREAIGPSAATPAVSKVLGIFGDHPVPPKVKLIMRAEADGCQLFVPERPLCEMVKCTSMEQCTDDEVCTPKPAPQNVGTVHLTAGSAEVDVGFVATSYQLKAGVNLPYPACAEGEPVKIEAEGGEYEPFEIETRCIDVLEVGGPFPMEPGKPLELTWSAPESDHTRMQIKLDVSHHGGGSKGQINCDLPDTGSFSIPAELVDGLLDLGTAGFPTIQMTRVAVGHPEGEPRNVTLSMTMMQERAVTIPGVVSCDEATLPCPSGMVCQPDYTCK